MPFGNNRVSTKRKADLGPLAAKLKELSLLEFVPEVSPHMCEPTHLAPIAAVFQRALGSNQRIVVSAPRQHGKSEIIKHALPYLHIQDPTARLFYATYSSSYTEIQSRDIRRIYNSCGIPLRQDYNTLSGWGLSAGGDFTASSVEGRANGLGADVLVIDDYFRSGEEAYSAKKRDEVARWYLQVVVPMLAPGASAIIVASRWDADDLSGRLIKDHGYDEIRLEAINEIDEKTGLPHDPNRPLGAPLCPNGPDPKKPRDLNFLLEIKEGRLRPDNTRIGGIGEAAWSALFQGKPLPPGGALFQGVHVWPEAVDPKTMVRVVIGLDLAYSTGAGSDFTAAVVLGEDAHGNIHVLEAKRMKQELVAIEGVILDLQKRYPGSRTVSYVSGQEKAILELLFHRNVVVEGMPARWSKIYRAQKAAAAWNQKKVFVPFGSPEWLEVFLHEVKYFTGVTEMHDDQIDALVGAFDALEAGRPVAEFAQGFTFGSFGI
jgi:predicted phage terminase large subunit-like protein